MLLKEIMAAIFVISSCAGYAQDGSFNIIPEPVKVLADNTGTYQIHRGTMIRTIDVSSEFSAEYFADYMEQYLGMSLSVEKPAKDRKGRKHRHSLGKETFSGITLVNLKNGGTPGGYQLEVTANGVQIEGNDEAGVFYGIQTLIQLLPTRAGVLPILPSVQITDYPRFAYRGMHLDVVRHFFPVAFIKKYLDYMALHKLNYFHWHLTDDQAWRVEMKCRPELTEKGAEP